MIISKYCIVINGREIIVRVWEVRKSEVIMNR